MKEHNLLVKFKNSFITDPTKQETLTPILVDDLGNELAKKMKAVGELYRAQAAENGYSPALAYRVIILHLMAPNFEGFDFKEEVLRFFRHCLSGNGLEGLQMCFDILLMQQLAKALTMETVRLLKARVLRGLREHYQRSGEGKEKRKCAFTLQEYCKDCLNREQVKRSPEIYAQLLDFLIQEVKRKVSAFLKRKAHILAIEELSAFTQVLEKSQQIVSRKYQLQLMEAYWSLAALHEQMHYQAYTRKYATIALNIAERTDTPSQAKEIRKLLDRLS